MTVRSGLASLPRVRLAAACIASIGFTGASPLPLAAQQWNDSASLGVVSRAIELRTRQIADPALADYTADAKGFLTFHGQVTDGLRIPPVLVKATEIAVKLYWMQPGRTKQVIVGMRDTLLLPGDIGYYQERYGIIQNNFPDVIRLGAGRDVRDVPHPLSRLGLDEYDFAIRDSISITLVDQTIDVYEVAVRPHNDALPRVIGKLYLARSDGAVARMSLTFTRAAFIDKRNELLTVTLDNALVQGRFWLPRRQELDLERSSDVLDFPIRTIIRARWEVCCYDVNINVPPAVFVGPEIVRSSPSVMQQYKWDDNIMKALPPDVHVLTPHEVQTIRAQAEQMVRARALARPKGGAIAAKRISDFVRVNRVEGVALGAGARLRSGNGLSLSMSGRYGLADAAAKGRVELSRQKPGGPMLQLYAARDYGDASDIQERSLALNTLAAPLFGSDYTDLYDTRGAGFAAELSDAGGIYPRFELSYQQQAPVEVNIDPVSGTFARTIPASRIKSAALNLSLQSVDRAGPFATRLNWRASAEIGAFTPSELAFRFDEENYLRGTVSLTAARPLGAASVMVSAFAGAVGASSDVPAQKLFFIGGPVSAPGYSFHELAGEVAATLHAELRLPVPFFSVSLGRYGRSPASATIAPYANAVYVDRAPAGSARSSGVYPSVGVGALVLFDLLRLDVARGLRNGRWTFSADIMREFWGVL